MHPYPSEAAGACRSTRERTSFIKHGRACSRAKFSLLLIAVLSCIALLDLGRAQTLEGSITGTITDPSGADVPAAQVTLSSSATGVKVGTFSTDRMGVYRFGNLPEGMYELGVTASGFSPYIHTGITVHVSELVTANAHREVRALGQTVQVQGGASTLNFEDSTKAAVPTRAVDELPPT